MTRSTSLGYHTKSAREIFSEKKVNNAMDPTGLDVRESRDSEEHPNSIPVILALDVTGSMGSIPHFLVKDGLPTMVDSIIRRGIADPQVLFLGIGDHECDQAPLQVGQFESSDELMDHWLTKLFIESGGGGNDGESYHLAWYLAANHTATDHWERRNQKGLLFTIGDEPVLRSLPQRAQQKIMGTGRQYEDLTAAELLDAARERYEVFHLHLIQGFQGRRENVVNGWRELMGDNLICVEQKEDVARIITEKIHEVISAQGDYITPPEMEIPTPAEME
jgi:hypothetical protein